MTQEAVINIVAQAVWVTIKASAPLLIVSLVIGLIVSIFQTVTSIQEQTLTFIPKVVGIFIALVLLGSFILNEIVGLVSERLPKFYKFDKLKDIQVLTPMKKGNLGSINLNKEIQNVLNPHHPMKKEIEYRNNFFRIGDKVMQTKNNYSIKWERIKGFGDPAGEGVFNGDVGYIKDIDEENNIDIGCIEITDRVETLSRREKYLEKYRGEYKDEVERYHV